MGDFSKIDAYRHGAPSQKRRRKGQDSILVRGARVGVAGLVIGSGANVLDDIYHGSKNADIHISDYGLDGNLLKFAHIPDVIPSARAAEYGAQPNASTSESDDGILEYLKDGAKSIVGSTKPYLESASNKWEGIKNYISSVKSRIFQTARADASEVTHIEVSSGMGYKVEKGKLYSFDIKYTHFGIGASGMMVNLDYDPNILTIINVTEGNLFAQNGTKTYFNEGVVEPSKKTIRNIFCVPMGLHPATNDGVFVSIVAKATATGTTGLNLSNTQISTEYSTPIEHDNKNATLTVYATPPPRSR